MLLIKKSITAQDQTILLDIYLENEFSITVINNTQKVLFLQDALQSYIVDENEKTLVLVPGSEEQIGQIKNLLGEVWVDEVNQLNSTYKQRSYHIANNFITAQAKLTGEVAVCIDDRLTPTVNKVQNTYEGGQQPFQIALAENEILSYAKTLIEVGGQKIASKMEIVSIEDAIMPEHFRDFLNYTVSAKAA